MTGYIYALVKRGERWPQAVVYVGETRNSPERRCGGHLKAIRLGWGGKYADLRCMGDIDWIELEDVEADTEGELKELLHDREFYWKTELRAAGAPLVNRLMGREGANLSRDERSNFLRNAAAQKLGFPNYAAFETAVVRLYETNPGMTLHLAEKVFGCSFATISNVLKRLKKKPSAPTADPADWDLPAAARYVRVSRSIISRAIRNGELKATRVGRQTRVRLEDVDAWMMSSPIQPQIGATQTKFLV